MVYADLHVHTNHSDGTQEIRDVLMMAKAKGIQTIAITDHDTINHLDEVEQIGKKLGIRTIRGVEMSCYDEEVAKKIHVVGLWLNEKAPHVEALCQKTLACRDAYHHKLIENLSLKDYHITYEDAKKYSPYNIVFKIHIFLALMEKYPKDMTPQKYRELFASKTSKETDLQMGYIDIREGIEAIRKDGGIAIIAHPCEYSNYDEIAKYVEYGLQGIEISHPSMKEEDYPLVQKYVKRFNLFQSGGSDFHDPRLTQMGQYGLTQQQFEELENHMRKVKEL
ncbi:PHP domain-containing protein [Candidatus Stoquefichus sp. SB1]|uniref:PHP domain-containing protein n=1 Tax=Candidatus Stoquefichus sp. SB1 TaxID=1658109 RepID=UPI00067F408F|nr:PHP domain-containing protein [Candidatus Stoquefichus sp. SB1]